MTTSHHIHAGHNDATMEAMPADDAAPAGAITAIDPVYGMAVNLKADTRAESFSAQTGSVAQIG